MLRDLLAFWLPFFGSQTKAWQLNTLHSSSLYTGVFYIENRINNHWVTNISCTVCKMTGVAHTSTTNSHATVNYHSLFWNCQGNRTQLTCTYTLNIWCVTAVSLVWLYYYNIQSINSSAPFLHMQLGKYRYVHVLRNAIYCKFIFVCEGFIWKNSRPYVHRKINTRKHNSST